MARDTAAISPLLYYMMMSQPMQSPVQPADMAANFRLQQQALQNQYQAKAKQYAANVGGISGLASMLALGAGI
jgi:hypothetical protein